MNNSLSEGVKRKEIYRSLGINGLNWPTRSPESVLSIDGLSVDSWSSHFILSIVFFFLFIAWIGIETLQVSGLSFYTPYVPLGGYITIMICQELNKLWKWTRIVHFDSRLFWISSWSSIFAYSSYSEGFSNWFLIDHPLY